MWLEWPASENHILFDTDHFFLQQILSKCVTNHMSRSRATIRTPGLEQVCVDPTGS